MTFNARVYYAYVTILMIDLKINNKDYDLREKLSNSSEEKIT